MNFLINILSALFNRFISTSDRKGSNNSDTNINVNRVENTNAIAEATAFLIGVCAVILGFYWSVRYSVASIFWIKHCVAQNQLVDFPIKTDELFEMIYSLVGLGVAGVAHSIVKRLYLGRKDSG